MSSARSFLGRGTIDIESTRVVPRFGFLNMTQRSVSDLFVVKRAVSLHVAFAVQLNTQFLLCRQTYHRSRSAGVKIVSNSIIFNPDTL